MKTRHVDAATSPHTYSSTPNIFFSILLLPEKANVKEFTKTYQKEGDFYFIQGAKKKKEKKAKSHETIRSQESFCSRSRSRSECCSVCSCCDFDRCHSSLRFEDQEPRQSNSKGLQFYAIEGRRPRSSCAVNFECVECNNNCNAPENCPKKVSQSDEIEVIVENGDEVDRRNSELIKQELLMRDALRKELLKSCSNEPRYEGCFKKSIPCLITPAAIIFCLLNFFIPGSGTLFCSLSILVFGCETGYGSDLWKRAFIISFIAALIQFTTCLIVIGWVWSIMWGVDLVMLSSNYTCDKENKSLFEEEFQCGKVDAKETVVIDDEHKKRKRIQFLDTYLSKSKQMEQMI